MAKLSKKACAIIDKSREHLSQRGTWVKTAYADEKERHCLVGELCLHAQENPYAPYTWSKPLKDAVYALARTILPNTEPKDRFNARNIVTAYNDRARTRKQDVLGILERAKNENC